MTVLFYAEQSAMNGADWEVFLREKANGEANEQEVPH
jgi:hypothetical protein